MRILSSRFFKAFRNAMLIGATGLAVKLLHFTVRQDVRGFEGAREAGFGARGVIFVFWHENLLLALGHEGRRGTHAVISAGRDGDFGARVLARWFGIGAVRGSSSRRALSAVRTMLRDGGQGRNFAFTPDGPRGPRRSFDGGAAFVAQHTALPIIPLGVAARRGYRLGTWDRMVVPKPFTRIVLDYGPPLRPDPHEDRPTFERRVAAALAAAQDRAEHGATPS